MYKSKVVFPVYIFIKCAMLQWDVSVQAYPAQDGITVAITVLSNVAIKRERIWQHRHLVVLLPLLLSDFRLHVHPARACP